MSIRALYLDFVFLLSLILSISTCLFLCLSSLN